MTHPRFSMTLKQSTRKPPTAAEVGKFKASRQAALARVASLKQKEGAQKREAERKAEKERQETKAESAARATALRAVTSTRVKKAATVNRQREREAELIRRDEERAKRERIAAVLAYDEAKADERERQVRSETYHRIRREERRRELSLQCQEEERMERMRLHEAGERYVDPPVAPAVQLARSFFSVAGSTVSESGGLGGGARGGVCCLTSPVRVRARDRARVRVHGTSARALERQAAHVRFLLYVARAHIVRNATDHVPGEESAWNLSVNRCYCAVGISLQDAEVASGGMTVDGGP